jgi:hypothetical protein
MSDWQERLTRLNMLYVVGLLLAIGGCNGVFLLEGRMVFVTLILYLAGLALAWFSGVDTFFRLLALLLPAVVFVSVYTVIRDDRVREPAAWLIPEGYTGPVYVFFREPCGTAPEFEEGARVYRPDTGGLAFTGFAKNYGLDVEEPSFYHYGVARERRLLKNIRMTGDTATSTRDQRDPDHPGIYAFPGQPMQGETDLGKFYLDYAFIGTYTEYLAFLRESPLPEEAPEELLRHLDAWRRRCR